MKRKHIFPILLLVLTMALTACGNPIAETQDDKETSEIAETENGADAVESGDKDIAALQKTVTPILEPIASYEIGTAGSSLKACIAANHFMKLYKDSGLADDDFKDGAEAYFKALSKDEQDQFSEQAAALKNSYPEYFTTDGAGIIEESGVGELAYTEAEADKAFGLLMEAIGAQPSSALLDAFVNNEIPAEANGASTYSGEDQSEFYLKDLPNAENADEWEAFSVGDRMDLDNDGEDELILNGPYGGMYIDAADGKVSVLAAGEGTASVLMYAKYEDAVWVVHADTMHEGREIYHLDRYSGSGNIQESCELSAEFEDSPDDTFHEDSTFTFRDKQISMSEFKELRDEMFADYYSDIAQ